MVKAGDWIHIESRKHDGSFHRAWKQSLVLEVTPTEILVANEDVEVTESDGHSRISSGLAICQFYRNKWYNIILLFDASNFNHWYCNIASPFRLSGNSLIYTDYDWDLSVDVTGGYHWLDQEEFEQNCVRHAYPYGVKRNVEEARTELESRWREGKKPFTSSFVESGYHRYLLWKKLIDGVK
ncbi:DUF402 domain-containing protein [Desmospora activa]|uniref:DUF402 domain-containing protein n=1 Tax=Desmospora activa DSM 45169 TaxID=1121389 RepID=A0A2T4Z3I0_9BACL|nr:DUF402 domain-containing protein [Desmospora activa]PTM56448.1 hypothetical protein C8J48_2770 [Desmospora activa DSM 45169]